MDQETISTLESTPQDKIEVKYIEDVLRNDYDLYESKEDNKKREEVLLYLKNCLKESIKTIYKKNGKTESEAEDAGGAVFSFGSYRLGIVGPGDDIDVLCIAPSPDTKDNNGECKREELYEEMIKQLEKIKNEKEITQIFPVRDAYVPIIKIIIKEIPIDILVARVSFKTIGKNFNLKDDNVLRNCCDKCILSLNGCRVTDGIFELLPKELNPEDFKLTLRAIKLWAKKRGIYSNQMGYPGGVAWAILVAKICQLYPKCKANILIRKFFETYSEWNWEKPVKINEVREDVGFNCPIKVWKKDEKSNHCPFYIITPAFPAQNTNYNTNQITKTVMIEEFTLFKEYTKKIKINENSEYTWKGLFQEINIFNEYKYFLQIDILANKKDAFKSWQGLVDSQLRKLIGAFIEFPQIKLRPFSIGYDIKDEDFPFSKTYFYGVKFIDPEKLEHKPSMNINLREPIKVFVQDLEKKRKNDKDKNIRFSFKTSKELPIEILQIKKKEN